MNFMKLLDTKCKEINIRINKLIFCDIYLNDRSGTLSRCTSYVKVERSDM